ncbi:MAG: hypothetical protein WB992_21455 [Bryobacteraceae bacterium]
MLLYGFLLAKEGLNISAAAHDVKNRHILVFDPINDDVLADWKAPEAGAQIFVSAAAHERVTREKVKPLRDRVNQSVGNVHAAAFFGDV